jgi:hypothetical protein
VQRLAFLRANSHFLPVLLINVSCKLQIFCFSQTPRSAKIRFARCAQSYKQLSGRCSLGRSCRVLEGPSGTSTLARICCLPFIHLALHLPRRTSTSNSQVQVLKKLIDSMAAWFQVFLVRPRRLSLYSQSLLLHRDRARFFKMVQEETLCRRCRRIMPFNPARLASSVV